MLKKILTLLSDLQQPHLAEGLEGISSAEQTIFLQQLQTFAPLLQEQRKVLMQSAPKEILEPVTGFERPDESARAHGEKLLSQGKVACLILAGGQGTRLGSAEPKALFPVTSVRKKTLLQFFCEKTAAASRAYNSSLKIAVMGSSLNRAPIEKYLQENRYFGVEHMRLFAQEDAPFVNDAGNWFLEAPGCLAAGPDGNGHSLRQLMRSGIGHEWKQQGVEFVMVVPIDNPLADPFDAALCGYHALTKREATLKTILRADAAEKVGVVVRKNNRIAVQEYSELPPQFEAPLAHIGLFCFSLSFLERSAEIELPWHVARKKNKEQTIWKFERFIFDILSHAEQTGVVVYPREETYAPLKNLAGAHSLATVQEAMAAFDRRLLADLTQAVPAHAFELDPAFYYLTPALKSKWRQKRIPDSAYFSHEG